MTSMEELKNQIKDLEQQLEAEKQKNKAIVRTKITQMSSEVVDSNPYR